MNNFQKDAKIANVMFDQFLKKIGFKNKYWFTKNDKDWVDGWIRLSSGKDCCFELKNLKKDFKKILIEKAKYEHMYYVAEHVENSVDNGYYIAFLSGKIYFYKLTDITWWMIQNNDPVTTILTNKTTSEDNGQVYKEVYFLPLDLACQVYKLDTCERIK